MPDPAVVLERHVLREVSSFLASADIATSDERLRFGNRLMTCRRGRASVTVGVIQPAHWVGDHARGDLFILAVIREPWRLFFRRLDLALEADILTCLRPHAWVPPHSGAAQPSS